MGVEDRIRDLEKRVRVQGNIIDTLLSFVNKLDEELSTLRKEVEKIKKASEVRG